MGRQYKCIAFGSCDQAGNAQWAAAGGSPECPSCGSPMRPAVGTNSLNRSALAIRAAVFATLVVMIVVGAWYWFSPRNPATPERSLLGRWQAEETSVMGVALPVGIHLEFTQNDAVVLDQRVMVTSYQTEGDRVHVEVPAGSGIALNLSFRFIEANRIIYEGPLGIEVRYRRRKDVP